MNLGFGEGLVLDFGFEAEQSRHDVRALDINHESDLSLYVEIVFDKPSLRVFVHPRFSHPPFSLG